jgi:hypothetical protein
MNAILLILHFFGLAAGFSASIGNFAVMRLIQSAPADAPILSKVPPVLARIGQTGLALLWVTGIIMVWSIYGGPGNLPASFWIKFAFVILATIGVGMIDMTQKAIRAGDQSARARLPMLGMGVTLMVALAVVFAVIAFM